MKLDDFQIGDNVENAEEYEFEEETNDRYDDESRNEEKQKIIEQQMERMKELQQQAETQRKKDEKMQEKIDRASIAQMETPKQADTYYEVVCEKCGHTFFVREGDDHEYNID